MEGNGTSYRFLSIIKKPSANILRKEAVLVTASFFLPDRSDGKKICYFYDKDGIIGFNLNGTYYNYVTDGRGNVIAIAEHGYIRAKYEYDHRGIVKVFNDNGMININSDFIGNINPIRWKGYYYDVESGLYYANGRYCD